MRVHTSITRAGSEMLWKPWWRRRRRRHHGQGCTMSRLPSRAASFGSKQQHPSRLTIKLSMLPTPLRPHWSLMADNRVEKRERARIRPTRKAISCDRNKKEEEERKEGKKEEMCTCWRIEIAMAEERVSLRGTLLKATFFLNSAFSPSVCVMCMCKGRAIIDPGSISLSFSVSLVLLLRLLIESERGI